jgi:hypothetical protein
VEAAYAVSEEHAEEAWRCVHDAVIIDQWLVQHGPKQSVALHDLYRATVHPYRSAYLAAAARTAALIVAIDQPGARRIRNLLASH